MKKTLFLMTLVIGVTIMGFGCQSGTVKTRTTSSSSLPIADKDEVRAVLVQWKEAAIAKDTEKVLEFYSEKFEHYEWGTKSGFAAFLKDTKGMGYLEKASLNIDNAKLTASVKTPGAIEVYPIDMTAQFGSARLGLVLKKEGVSWKIVGMSAEVHS